MTDDPTSRAGKGPRDGSQIVLVTGATSGIGFHTGMLRHRGEGVTEGASQAVEAPEHEGLTRPEVV